MTVEITIKCSDDPRELREAARYLSALAEHRSPAGGTAPQAPATPITPTIPPEGETNLMPPQGLSDIFLGVSCAQAGEGLASSGRASVSTAQAEENLASVLAPTAPTPPTVSTGGAVPAPPPVEAPVTSVPTGLVPRVEAPSVETDKSGVPWDERIHAGTKVKTVDGNWRKRRGLSEGEYERVLAEIQPAPSAPSAPAEPAQVKTFAELAQYVTKRLALGTLSGKDLLECCPNDVTMFTAMASRTEAEIIETFNKLRLI